MSHSPSKTKQTKSGWLNLVVWVMIAILIRWQIVEPRWIPSGSMLPTIQIGDHIFASMYSYGSPIPFTEIKFFKKPIKRGDIIIFPYPRDPSIDYIKRAVGLPGEKLEIKNDQVLINGEVEIYQPRGDLTLKVKSVKKEGLGDISKEIQVLRKRLELSLIHI